MSMKAYKVGDILTVMTEKEPVVVEDIDREGYLCRGVLTGSMWTINPILIVKKIGSNRK